MGMKASADDSVVSLPALDRLKRWLTEQTYPW